MSRCIVRSHRAAMVLLTVVLLAANSAAAEKMFRAGAFAIDVSPLKLPVIVNGGMTQHTADTIQDRLHARCLVLDDGTTKLAFAVVDNCMMPRDLLDEVKRMASAATGIKSEHMLVSATHTHSAPSVYGCLGTDRDEDYAQFLPGQIAKGIQMAHDRLVPARIGWAVGRDPVNVGCRHWLMKPGTAPTNRFSGIQNDRAQMHPGFDNPNAIRATGPTDPEVPVLSVQTRAGKPLAVLTNYSMHYVGTKAVSADYFAVVCENVRQHVGGDESFVGLHSNGTSGDQWLMEYTLPKRREFSVQSVAKDVAQAAFDAYKTIRYFDWVPLVMEESKLELGVRMPTAQEVADAQEFLKGMKTPMPKTVEEVYARETVILSKMPATRELKLQALRIGGLAISAIPNETFCITGLTLKQKSPLKPSFTISLANGCEGYIPPPDLIFLGGYTSWRARTSCLETDAEPKITLEVARLLNSVAKSRADELAIPSSN